MSPSRPRPLLRPLVIGGATVVAVVSPLVGIGWPAVLLSLALLTLSFPTRLGWVARLVLGLGSLTALTLLAGFGFSVLGVSLDPRLLFVGLATVSGAVGWFRAELQLRSRPGDLMIALSALACLLIAVSWGWSRSPAELVFQLSQGGDNSNHINLIRTIQLGRGFGYGATDVGLFDGMQYYPQGFAFLIGYLGWAFCGLTEAPTVAETVQGSWALFAVIPAIGVALLLLTVRRLITRDGAAVRTRTWAMTGFSVTAVVMLAFFIHLISFGFQTQIFATVVVLAGVWLVCELHPADRPPARAATTRALTLVGLAAGLLAVANSWYLMAPPLVILALTTIWPLLRRPASAPWWLWPALLVAAAGSIYPVLHGNPDASGSLTMPGGIRIFDAAGAVGLLVIAILVLRKEFALSDAGPGRPRPAGPIGAVTLAILAGLALAVAVGAFQLVQAGAFSYYFFKVLYLPAVLAVVLLGLGVARVAQQDRLLPQSLRPGTVLAGLAMLALLFTVVREVPHFVRTADRGAVATEVIDALLTSDPNGLPADQDVVAAGYCDPKLSGQTTGWIGGLFLSWTVPRSRYYTAVDRAKEENAEFLQTYLAASPGRTVTVHVRDDCPGTAALVAALPTGTPVVTDN